MDVDCRADVSMNTIKERHIANEQLCYCPSWTVARKLGRPKKNVREKSVMDHINKAAKKKCKRQARMFCKICHRFDHTTEGCFKNSKNRLGEGGENDGDGNVDGEQGLAERDKDGDVADSQEGSA